MVAFYWLPSLLLLPFVLLFATFSLNAALLLPSCPSFVFGLDSARRYAVSINGGAAFRYSGSSTQLWAAASDFSRNVLTIEIDKPLGLILEEVDENAAAGVRVQSIADVGSASKLEYRNALVGSMVVKVMDVDVTALAFDHIMEIILNASSPVRLEFRTETDVDTNYNENEQHVGEAATNLRPHLSIGTPVTVIVIQRGKETLNIETKVGDNLRMALLENKVELYRGMKKQLGNCGGAGQCTFCAVDFINCDGWEQRSEYEENKLRKYPNARLACLNNIQGPATIRVE